MIRGLIATAVILAPNAASAAWQEASSKHFVVYADDTPTRVQAFTTQLERFDQSLRALRKIADPAISPTSRVTVYVVRDTAEIRRLAGKRAGDVAGFYVPRARGSVAFVPRQAGDAELGELSSLAVLLHEYSHHFMFASMTTAVYPAWFVEGFAEFNATARFEKNGDVTIGLPPLYRAGGLLYGPAFPAAKLLTVQPNALPDEQRGLFYGRAWLLTHYLTVDADRRQQLIAYLEALAHGASPATAAAKLGDLRQLDAALDRYTQGRLSGFTLPAARLAVGTVTVRPMSAAEAAIMPARLLSERGITSREDAAATAARARTLAAAYSSDLAAQLVLARAEYEAGNLAEGGAAADRALAADPSSTDAMIDKGLTELAMARQTRSRDRSRDARRWFSKANHADPEAPWPLVMYYRSYTLTGEQPTRNAEDGLLYALRLAPFDQQLSMNAARVYLSRGELEKARTTLQPVAYNPHGGRYTVNARNALAMLDRVGPDRTLAWWPIGPAPNGSRASPQGPPPAED